MTLTQFAIACGADHKWIQNAAARLNWSLAYTQPEALRFGLIRQIQGDLGVPLETAERFADAALAEAGADPSDAVLVGRGSVARGVVDLRRYLSDFSVRLACAISHHEPRQRGRRSPGGSGAVARARACGLDIGHLWSSLARTPADRLRRLDRDMEFARALRGRR